jgi:hypothetical protein
LINRAYKFVLPLLGLWLAAWIFFSWGAIQDDALIHLRYADNLYRTHFITYDGIHASYGASSLLYVHVIAFLSGFISSPSLPRGVSSFMHVSLFLITSFILVRFIPRESPRTRLLGLVLLFILVAPSAVRWLDDGMETGFALCFVALLCILAFRQYRRSSTPTPLQYLMFAVLAFFTVLLRTELALLCGVIFAMLVWKQVFDSGNRSSRWIGAILRSSHVLVGCLLALLFIVGTMHSLLPDTALAKSGTASWAAFYNAATVIVGALTFGLGLMVLWFLTIFFLVRAGRFSVPVLFANLVFPAVLLLAAIRGQEIQGARYLVWTYFFSVLWNLLELGSLDLDRTDARRQSSRLVYVFILFLLIALPFECKIMGRVLSVRVQTMKIFEGQHLEVLQGKEGIASDVGYIGYFSKANICDAAGLVDGRAFARLTLAQRLEACADRHPDFVFGNLIQVKAITDAAQGHDWQVCTHYDFGNVRTPDTHYLVLPGATAAQTCQAIAGATPYPLTSLFAQQHVQP